MRLQIPWKKTKKVAKSVKSGFRRKRRKELRTRDPEEMDMMIQARKAKVLHV